MVKRRILKFWTIFLAILFPRVDEPTPPSESPDPANNDPDPSNADPDPELSDEPAAPAPAVPASSTSTDELVALREQNRAMTAALATLSGGNRPAATRAPSEDERILQDPQASPEQKWQAQANLALAQGFNNSQQALQMARDAADAASFNLKCMEDPLAKKYAKDVEAKRQSFVSVGRIPPDRDLILTWVIGEKARARVVAGAGKAKPTEHRTNTPAPRGSTPAARSDVRTGGKTESDKRRARLENIQI